LKSFQKPFVKRLREELPLFLNFSTGYEEFLSVKNKSVGIYLTYYFHEKQKVYFHYPTRLELKTQPLCLIVLFLIHIDTNPLFV